MQRKSFHRIVATLIVAVSVGMIGCNDGASAGQSAATPAAASKGAPSGAYESPMPGGTVMRLSFHDGGAVEIAMTEDGQTNSHTGKWVLNGEVILVEGDEGMLMQFHWQGDALVTDFGGTTMTFNRI